MSKKRLEELKEDFKRQFLFEHRKFQGFNCLLRYVQAKRLVPYEREELHTIYKEKKVALLDDTIKLFNDDTLPYPLGEMHKAITVELNLRGVTEEITGEQFKRVYAAAYAAVMDAEYNDKQETKDAIKSAVRNAIEDVFGGAS